MGVEGGVEGGGRDLRSGGCCTWLFFFLRHRASAPVARLPGRRRRAILRVAGPMGSGTLDIVLVKRGARHRNEEVVMRGLGLRYHSDSCARGNEVAVDLESVVRYHALKGEGKGGMHPGGFVHASFEVGQGLGLLPCHKSRDSALGCGIVDLVLEFGKGGRVFEEMI